MGVKCDIFVEYKYGNDDDSDIQNCKQQVMSEMITFDYDSSTMAHFSENTNNQIQNLFDQYKKIRLICEINAIQRYDGYSRVMTHIPINLKQNIITRHLLIQIMAIIRTKKLKKVNLNFLI